MLERRALILWIAACLSACAMKPKKTLAQFYSLELRLSTIPFCSINTSPGHPEPQEHAAEVRRSRTEYSEHV